MRAGREIGALTGLRGVAALYVVLFHFFPGVQFTGVATFVGHGYLAVDLFFVLSGFVMALNYGEMFAGGWSEQAYTKFLGRRIARVYPLYIVATTCACGLIATGILAMPHVQVRPVDFLLNALMIQTWGLGPSLDSPAWSISAEWAAYLLFPVMLAICLNRRPWVSWIAGFAAFGVVAGLAAAPASVTHHPNPQALLDISDFPLALPVVRCLAEFSLGLLAYRLAGTRLGGRIAKNGWIAAGLGGAIVALLFLPRTDLLIVALLPFLVLTLSGASQGLARLLASGPAEWAGRISYSIYLIHALLQGLISGLHHLIEDAGIDHAQTIAAAISVPLMLALSYLAYRFIEVPGRRLLRQRFERGRLQSIDGEPSAP